MDNKPERIRGWRMSQLSIARFYGGCMFNGAHYVIDPITDDLVREDVLARERKEAKRAEKEKRTAKRDANKEAQMWLMEGAKKC